MADISLQVANHSFGLLGHSTIRVRQDLDLGRTQAKSVEPITRPLPQTLRQVIRLREALESLPTQKLRTRSRVTTTAPQIASAISANPLSLGAGTAASLQSSEEINIAPTSYSKFGPTFNGSTVTVPWSGPGSTAEAAVSGSYDGSNGSGTLKFLVNQDGTHGTDDLRIKVYDPNGTFIENVDIKKTDPLNKVYTLSNGLEITLGAGDILKNEFFTVDTRLLSTSFGPSDPQWAGSSANATIGGTYNGSNGTGALTFKVIREGTHGVDDLRLRMFAPNGAVVQDIDIKKNDNINKVYSLSNGLTLKLDAGTLIKDESFIVNVNAANPQATGPLQPAWQLSSATATFSGTYDGSQGTGTLTFVADRAGTHGSKDLRLKVYGTDGNFLENIDIAQSDPLNKVYALSNGLTFTLSAGDLIKGESFTLDVTASATFSTSANPVESTAEPTIDGVYNGSLGTGTITFQVSQSGTHGVDNLALDVYGPDQSLLETINILASDPIDQVYSLASGLTLQLAGGTLVLNETFVVDVNDQIGSAVDPDKPFNGIRNDKPNFDYGVSVSFGSFDINGVSINVLADDTLNSVLDRINQAGVDVTASFDPDTESVLLTRNTPGFENGIILENDTSGFLAAAKLAENVLVSGGSDLTKPIVDVNAFDSISSGALLVNGVSISVDINVDCLEDIIGRMNDSGAGVTASFDDATGRFSVVGSATGEDFTLASGDTGFFPALGIPDGTYEGTTAQVGVRSKSGYSSQIRNDISKTMYEVSAALNELFTDKVQGDHNDPYLEDIRHDIRAEVAAAFGSAGPRFATDFGIALDFKPGAADVLHFGKANQKRLIASLGTTRGAKAFRDLLYRESKAKTGGLADRLIAVTARVEQVLRKQLSAPGAFVDVYA